ncbi:MAG: SIS domain-containing protein [Chthoniobacteraceae bacterium]
MLDWLNNYIAAQKKALDTINPAAITPLIATLREAHRTGRRIYVCGNGGSAANASHFTTDLGKNSSAAMPSPFRVLSLTDNTPWITAIGNDYSFDDAFVRQLQNYGEAGDVLIVISVSGNSPNLVKVLEWAKPRGMKTIALVGGKRGRAAELADQVVVVEDTHYGRVEDVQMNILHMLCYVFVEREDARK